jgi:26S proteasome regulatory subunit N2
LNKYDPNIMKNVQKGVEKGGSVPLLGAIISHSLMNSHTKNDNFLKENIEWLSKATNWARFTTTASLGVIHMGNVAQGRAVMGPYMPGNANFPSIYSQAGAYYGLGLIFAGTNDQEVLKTLIEGLSNSRDVFQHGIFLAIGLVAMASHDTGNQLNYKRSL